MAYKTREELMKEIENKNNEIKELKKEAERLERYKAYEKSADEVAAIRDSYVNAGFTKTEAFEMTKLMMNLAAKTAKLF